MHVGEVQTEAVPHVYERYLKGGRTTFCYAYKVHSVQRAVIPFATFHVTNLDS